MVALFHRNMIKLALGVFISAIIGLSQFSTVQAQPVPAYAPVDYTNTPIMLIRFNQTKVYYEQQLYNVISRAFATEPLVHFDVVNFVPANNKGLADGQQNLAKITRSMREIGVPEDRIHLITEPQEDLQYNEVHIFVRPGT